MKKALIVYGTRYGAAASTSEGIAKVLSQQGVDTKVVDLKKEKVKDTTGFDLVIVGSGIQINKWVSEPEDFLKKHQKELAAKKMALFVCCGSASTDKPEELAEAKQKYLQEKALKYNLQPVALGLFGGVYNFNKEPWWAKKAMELDRSRIEAAYKASEPGIYDTRDWNSIRDWVKDLAQKVVTG